MNIFINLLYNSSSSHITYKNVFRQVPKKKNIYIYIYIILYIVKLSLKFIGILGCLSLTRLIIDPKFVSFKERIK